ncbi:MAG: hypothetical protein ACYTFG_00945 [Planctomycetota bacterium]|jgi:hypothetical protein
MRKKILIAVLVFAAVIVISVVVLLVWRMGRAGPSGLVVQIHTSQESFRLGEPMRFTVVVFNASFKTVRRDFQGCSREIFEITGPDEDPIPYVVAPFSTLGGEQDLPPLGGLCVRNGVDILKEYAIEKEGAYTIRVKAIGEDLPPSNTISFEVKGGTPPVADVILKKISGALPQRWWTGRYSCAFESEPPWGRKDAGTVFFLIWGKPPQENRINLFFTETEAPEDRGRDPSIDLTGFLGKSAQGYFYYLSGKKTKESWPTYEDDLREALGIE